MVLEVPAWPSTVIGEPPATPTTSGPMPTSASKYPKRLDVGFFLCPFVLVSEDRTQRVDDSSAPSGTFAGFMCVELSPKCPRSVGKRGEDLLRSLIERPFGEALAEGCLSGNSLFWLQDAVGWHVAVLAEDHGYSNERYYTGWANGPKPAC